VTHVEGPVLLAVTSGGHADHGESLLECVTTWRLTPGIPTDRLESTPS